MSETIGIVYIPRKCMCYLSKQDTNKTLTQPLSTSEEEGRTIKLFPELSTAFINRPKLVIGCLIHSRRESFMLTRFQPMDFSLPRISEYIFLVVNVRPGSECGRIFSMLTFSDGTSCLRMQNQRWALDISDVNSWAVGGKYNVSVRFRYAPRGAVEYKHSDKHSLENSVKVINKTIRNKIITQIANLILCHLYSFGTFYLLLASSFVMKENQHCPPICTALFFVSR